MEKFVTTVPMANFVHGRDHSDFKTTTTPYSGFREYSQ